MYKRQGLDSIKYGQAEVRQTDHTFSTLSLSSLDRQINEVRLENGLKALKPSACAKKTAEIRAKEIEVKLDHYRPNGEYFDTAIPCKYEEAGENLAVAYEEGFNVVEEWLNSPTHKAVILNPVYEYVGSYQNLSLIHI